MQIQEILLARNLIHRRQVAGYPIATQCCICRSGSRADATSKMECFVIIVNGWKPLTIVTKHSILDGAAALDPPLIWYRDQSFHCIQMTGLDVNAALVWNELIILWLNIVIRLHSSKAFGEPLVFQISMVLLPNVSQIRKTLHFPETFSKGFVKG